MNILDLVVGKPIQTSEERAEQIGPAQGIPIFGLDALSSAAYGPEAALSLLLPLGLLERVDELDDPVRPARRQLLIEGPHLGVRERPAHRTLADADRFLDRT